MKPAPALTDLRAPPDPAMLRLVEAMARQAAREDHEAEQKKTTDAGGRR